VSSVHTTEISKPRGSTLAGSPDRAGIVLSGVPEQLPEFLDSATESEMKK
jgi:hypothetical protein